MWQPRTSIRRRQETLPPVRHPTASEPLMFHSARDEKGTAQESIGSWAFPMFVRALPSCSFPRSSYPTILVVVMPDSIRHLLNPRNSVKIVSRLICRKHICVFTRLRVYVFAYSHINTFVCLHTNMHLCSYTDMQSCVYNHIKT